MKKIVVKLVECSFSFSFEQRNSSGESIDVGEIDVEIHSYQGMITFVHEGLEEEFEENEQSFDYICDKIEQIMIDETSSF